MNTTRYTVNLIKDDLDELIEKLVTEHSIKNRYAIYSEFDTDNLKLNINLLFMRWDSQLQKDEQKNS